MPRREKLNSISTSLWESNWGRERERAVWMRGEAKIEWEVKKWARERSKVGFARGFTAKWKQHIFFADSISHIVACWILFACSTHIVQVLYKYSLRTTRCPGQRFNPWSRWEHFHTRERAAAATLCEEYNRSIYLISATVSPFIENKARIYSLGSGSLCWIIKKKKKRKKS